MRPFKPHFSLSVGAPGAPLHFAAHSHHPWPDVTRAAQVAAWDDAARLLDAKWGHIFANVIPEAQAHVARVLSLPDPKSIVFAPNTHEFVRRLISCFPATRPIRILSSDSEFHSFTRQVARLEEDGLAEIVRVPAQPFGSFSERLGAAARTGFDIAFVSQVFFNSGFVNRDLVALVEGLRKHAAFVVIDGYHGFMAVETDLSMIAPHAFYIAGGYKYAMAGEGACFMHCPPGFGVRPRDTGWYAEFGALGHARGSGTAFGMDGSRFAGATFDPSGLYRLNAVMRWQAGLGSTVGAQHNDAQALQAQFLASLESSDLLSAQQLVVDDASSRGRFLTFETDKAEMIDAALLRQNIVVDHRGTRLRIGFGIYQDAEDIVRLIEGLRRS